MSNHYYVANISKKEYIGCPDYNCNEVIRFWKKDIQKCFSQDLIELLATRWAGDKIQAYSGLEDDIITKNLSIKKNFFDEYKRVELTYNSCNDKEF